MNLQKIVYTIQSASLFCKQAYEIEDTFRVYKNVTRELSIRHFAYVSNALFSSVSFLEAIINELFANAAENQIWDFQQDHQKTIQLFGKMWELNIPRTAHYPILQKYEISLALAGKSSFDKGSEPYQNISSLIKLRNYLMHFEPEWIEIQPGKDNDRSANEHKFVKMFRGKFPENSLAHKNRPYFPDKCLSHGCAEWAMKNSIAFTDEFFKKIDLPTSYEVLKAELITR